MYCTILDLLFSKLLGFWIVETCCILFFTVEFILRYWSCPDRIAFIRSFMNLIDLAAIIPYYIDLAVKLSIGPTPCPGTLTGSGWNRNRSYLILCLNFEKRQWMRHRGTVYPRKRHSCEFFEWLEWLESFELRNCRVTREIWTLWSRQCRPHFENWILFYFSLSYQWFYSPHLCITVRKIIRVLMYARVDSIPLLV